MIGDVGLVTAGIMIGTVRENYHDKGLLQEGDMILKHFCNFLIEQGMTIEQLDNVLKSCGFEMDIRVWKVDSNTMDILHKLE